MTADEFANVWQPARDVYRTYAGHTGASFRFASEMMAELIGEQARREHAAFHANDQYPMDEELKQLLLSLGGPHGATLFRVLEIKRGVKHE